MGLACKMEAPVSARMMSSLRCTDSARHCRIYGCSHMPHLIVLKVELACQ